MFTLLSEVSVAPVVYHWMAVWLTIRRPWTLVLLLNGLVAACSVIVCVTRLLRVNTVEGALVA
ncbi:hypothetical protein D3C80_1346870 [compost metagenome]